MSDDAFFAQLASLLGTPEITAEERTAVLDLTRVVAHGSERRYAPLTAWALALTLSSDDSAADRTARVRSAIGALEATMADPDGADQDGADPDGADAAAADDASTT